MPRKPRIWYPGAMYHITDRGNRKSALFYDDRDYETYLSILEDVRSKYPFHLHSYCLMTNHIHLQLETIDYHPQEIMRRLNSRYAIYFNKCHQLVGHVFQGRYGAEVIKSIEYELKVSQYIHLNPVVAKMVESPKQYRWSSYTAYVSNVDNPYVRTDKILSYFPNPAKERYRLFVERQSHYIIT